MAGVKSVYVCNNCGNTTNKWFGRCPACGEWNSLVEELVEEHPKSRASSVSGAKASTFKYEHIADVGLDDTLRFTTGIPELDRVLGGGIVKGSVVLIGGEPGAGKSTLLLQMSGFVGSTARVLYISGEESARQIKLRATRLGADSGNIDISTETDIETVCDSIRSEKPDLVVIDSIQTMNLTSLQSSPGSVTQVRECTSMLQRTAKSLEIPIFIIGHVNKDGAIAGPKVMEHIVDTVLYFENDRFLTYRILRAVKNRFGSTNEIGLFDMSASGLESVLSPSEALLNGRIASASGSCITCLMEGSRPLIGEIQSLCAKSAFGSARRTSSGIDYNRANLLLAVLEKRAGYYFSALDVYINVVGGIDIDETACDLAVVISLISSILDKPVPEGLVAFGEVGLGGEIRSVSSAQQRVNEAYRLGFTKVVLPKYNAKKIDLRQADIEIIGVSTVGDLKRIFE